MLLCSIVYLGGCIFCCYYWVIDLFSDCGVYFFVWGDCLLVRLLVFGLFCIVSFGVGVD